MKKTLTVRVGSRESRLALVQAGLVIDTIRRAHPEIACVIVPMSTRGDRIIDQPLNRIGGKGLFIKELETALLLGRIDLAVHSLKDMPAALPDGLELAAFAEREDPRDVLVLPEGRTRDDPASPLVLSGLPVGGRVGTGSARRELQLRRLRPDLHFGGLRGNVGTRLRKLDEGGFDALVLAAAGLRRLGLAERCAYPFSIEEMIPAVGQGVLAVEARAGENYPWLLDCVHHPATATCVAAERAFLAATGGGCSSPTAAHAWLAEGRLRLVGLLASDDRDRFVRGELEGDPAAAADLGSQLAARLRADLGAA